MGKHSIKRNTKGNRIVVNGNEATIFDSIGRSAVIDSSDVELINGFTWNIPSYAVTYVRQHEANCKAIFLHKLLLGAGEGDHVDHRDRDKTNNRRINLRLATLSLNSVNRVRPNFQNKSGYMGVTYIKQMRFRPWRAGITIDRSKVCVGCFSTPEEAALAYNDVARNRFGEFAILNDLSEFNEEEIRSRMKVRFMGRVSNYSKLILDKS